MFVFLVWGAVRQWGVTRDGVFSGTVDRPAGEKLPVMQVDSYSNEAEEASGTTQVVMELETRIVANRDAAVRVLRNWVESAA